jgi:hypothetical protein
MGKPYDFARCQNHGCPSRSHCLRYMPPGNVAVNDSQVFILAEVRPGEDRCDEYIVGEIRWTPDRGYHAP